MKAQDSFTPRVLIADDQADVLEALRLLIKSEGYHIETVKRPADIVKSIEERDFDVLLMDLNYTRDTTSGQEGLDLLTRIQKLDSTLPVVVMTAWSSVDVAVEAMRRGANVLAIAVGPPTVFNATVLDVRIDALAPDSEEVEEKLVTERAVVCDQCESLSGKRHACVYACPHEAAIRIDAWDRLPQN